MFGSFVDFVNRKLNPSKVETLPSKFSHKFYRLSSKISAPILFNMDTSIGTSLILSLTSIESPHIF